MADDDAGTPRPGPAAAYARNWKTVLLVDAGIAVVLVVLGAVAAVAWSVVPGALAGFAGAVYGTLVAQRARQWARLRREAGLTG